MSVRQALTTSGLSLGFIWQIFAEGLLGPAPGRMGSGISLSFCQHALSEDRQRKKYLSMSLAEFTSFSPQIFIKHMLSVRHCVGPRAQK